MQPRSPSRDLGVTSSVRVGVAALVLFGCGGGSANGPTARDAGAERAGDDGANPVLGSGGAMDSGGSAGASQSSAGGAGAGAGGASDSNAGGARGAGGAGDAGSTGGVGADAVRIVGRTDGDPRAPRFEWSSVSIQARFKGTRVSADIDGGNDNFFEVVVDGKVLPNIATTAGRRTVLVASGLTDAAHDLVLWRRTEANSGAPSQFFGLDLGGGLLLPAAAPIHKLEVIGDSITCGYGDEGAGPSCAFSFATENSYSAYGSVAARELGADLYTECWSGKGMYRNFDGGKTNTFPTLYARTIPTESASAWNFSWKPDAVVINLGTNDFSAGDPGQIYVNTYDSFVVDLRARYPNAFFFVAIGPMLSGTDLSTARGYLDDIVKARNDAGDVRIQQISIDAQDQANGIGCDYHPSVATHAIVGKTVASAIRAKMGW